MIKLIMSKIKSKRKINLLRCRARNQIDAPSVRALKIWSLEFSAVQPRSRGTGHSQQIQYRTVSRHISVLLQDYCRGGLLEAAAESWRNIFFIPVQNIPSFKYILQQFVHITQVYCCVTFILACGNSCLFNVIAK